jgi:transaldolase
VTEPTPYSSTKEGNDARGNRRGPWRIQADSRTLNYYIRELSVTGLTSNLTIFDHAIKNSDDYDDGIGQKLKAGVPVNVPLLFSREQYVAAAKICWPASHPRARC